MKNQFSDFRRRAFIEEAMLREVREKKKVVASGGAAGAGTPIGI